MNFPILSSITFLPLIGAFFVFLTRSEKNQINKGAIYVSLFTSFVNFFLTLFLWYSFDNQVSDFQFVEEAIWISGFINFKFGIDGISCRLLDPSIKKIGKIKSFGLKVFS